MALHRETGGELERDVRATPGWVYEGGKEVEREDEREVGWGGELEEKV